MINNSSLRQRLFSLADEDYQCFTSKLIPTVPPELVIGVRAPALRSLIREMTAGERAAFLADLPHKYHEENLLHAYMLSAYRDAHACAKALDVFLPHVDNWAVCDSLRPACLASVPDFFLTLIEKWLSSPHEYSRRFAVEMLMCYFLDERFEPRFCAMAAETAGGEYYMDMMKAWYFATALAKQWDAALPYLTHRRLSPWVHNKTIRKAIESCRISDEQKRLLRSLSIARARGG